jgi:O-antigen/teichoic acid export membrane protein
MPLRALVTPRRLRQLWYMPLLALAMALMLLRLLLMARLFDVNAFAVYSAGLLVSSSFCMLACLGLQPILQRELPVMIVRGRERPGSVLVAQCLLVAVACAALGMAAAISGASVAGLMPAQLALGLLHGLSQQAFVIATVESRSRGEPLRFARQNFERSLAVLAGGVLAAGVSGSAGLTLLTEAALSLALTAGLLWPQFKVRGLGAGATWRLALRRLPHAAWSSAGTLLAVGAIGFVLINLDRWVAAQVLPAPGFATYAFAWLVLMVAQSVQMVINASLYPLLARRFASGGRATAFRIAAQASLGLLAGAAVAALPLWALLDWAIARWFGHYAEARALLPAFLAIAALRVSDFWSSFMMIVGLERPLLLLQLAGGAVAVGAWWGTRPAAPGAGLLDIAWLAVLLTSTGYVAAAGAAWAAARRDSA